MIIAERSVKVLRLLELLCANSIPTNIHLTYRQCVTILQEAPETQPSRILELDVAYESEALRR